MLARVCVSRTGGGDGGRSSARGQTGHIMTHLPDPSEITIDKLCVHAILPRTPFRCTRILLSCNGRWFRRWPVRGWNLSVESPVTNPVDHTTRQP